MSLPITTEPAQALSQTLLNARMLVASLMGGVIMFAVVVLLLSAKGAPISTTALPIGLMTGIGGVLTVLLLTGGLLVRRLMFRRFAALEPDNEALPQLFIQATVLSNAIWEALGLYGAVIWLLSGDPIPGVVFVGIAMLVMAVFFPRRSQIQPRPESERGGDRTPFNAPIKER